nr:hypothetical protein [uncultured Bacillus sp.]
MIVNCTFMNVYDNHYICLDPKIWTGTEGITGELRSNPSAFRRIFLRSVAVIASSVKEEMK